MKNLDDVRTAGILVDGEFGLGYVLDDSLFDVVDELNFIESFFYDRESGNIATTEDDEELFYRSSWSNWKHLEA